MVLGKTEILITLGCDVLYIKRKTDLCGMSEDRVDSNVVVEIVMHLYNSLSNSLNIVEQRSTPQSLSLKR